MSPVEPIREQVQAALLSRLTTIVAGPVYWSTPAVVTRSLLSLDQYATVLATGPVLGVVRSSGSTLRPEQRTGAPAPSGWRDDFRVTIWGYVRGDAQTPAATRLERLWADVLTCLLTDPTLGGLVTDCLPVGALDTDDGALEPEAAFAQDWAAIIHR